MSNETVVPAKEETQAGRKVVLYSTKGKKQVEIFSTATVWGELKPQVEEAGYDLSTLIAAENVNRTTLEHVEARLPEGEFTLFMRPKRTKSGLDVDQELKFKGLRGLVKDFPDAKDFLNNFIPGKNWTQLTTDELRAGLTAFHPGQATQAVEVLAVTTETVENPHYAPVVAIVPVLEEVAEQPGLDLVIVDSVNDAIDFINETLLPELKNLVDPAVIAQREAEAKVKAEAEAEKQRLKEQEEKLATEASDFLAGF